MTDKTLPDYTSLSETLTSASLSVTPSELHGLLVGMLSGGLSPSDTTWQALLSDYTNEGMGWPTKALEIAQLMFDSTKKELMGTGFELTLILSDELTKESLFDVAESFSDWVNHFISGLGLADAKLRKSSQEVKEALADLEEIARLGIDEEDDLAEQTELLEQVMEHAKICALTIHAELGVKASKETGSDKKPTIH
ncbi:YecA family protein [Vibrio sp. S4M6]|uniref:YecA/YgfB family protein n=1 Tax=Vibrio sinus TaxID=2946865 RepID=UPI00202A1A25|nr:YecA family protein [Vibrio sinus]MCL9781563.1 YecA family protein [Vibrio sinus]